MNFTEIETFVESKREVIKTFFEKNKEENVFTEFFQLVDKNLDIINKLKNDYEKSGDKQEKAELEDMIKIMMKSVTESLAIR